MKSKNILVSLVAVLALFAFASIVSAGQNDFATFKSIEVNGVSALGCDNAVAVFADQTASVRVIFYATDNATDVRVKAWVSGESEYSAVTEKFDVVAGGYYSKLLNVEVPSRVDPDERMYLYVTIESSRNGITSAEQIPLNVQRESYKIAILDAIMEPKVSAGESLVVDLVLKNIGRHMAEDTFVNARIPALGIERRVFAGDMSPVDQADPDKEDVSEHRIVLNIPANAPAGVYTIEFEAVTPDSSAVVSKKFAIVGASGSSIVAVSSTTKTVSVGEQAVYSLTLVNSGNNVRLYEVAVESPEGLSAEADETLVAVPAGTSKTVKIFAKATKAGKYTFTAKVMANGDLVKTESFIANVGVSGDNTTTSAKTIGATTNTTLVLTIVLAIIFVVLLVVLIVLLTRKPQKSEEIGESYY